ncbi:Gag-pol Polyprotein [Phytophthora megakarya]|uniref:Gag-pol Polyprotein n=1 Tax=Phytophthora megakarya TaxID=4795 RepID=A0A225VGZ4_9STRA|nr:Gag-pol Polyprotein [Phytophthora megakarya]
MLTKLPIGYKALPCHWALAMKYNADGSIERFKARLVAQGNHQEFGVNCDEVYAPVARFESLRLVLAIGTILDCHIHQMDVHTAFLDGSMDGEQKVYMYKPPGYRQSGHEGLVYELKNNIYGLKHAPKIWYNVLHKFFTGLGFVRCNTQYCIYVQKVGEHWIIVVVYVDDLTIMSKDMRLINQLKSDLSSRFKMKDLGDIHYILKMEVRRNRKKRTMTISQHCYINDLLKKFKMEGCASVATPQLRGVELEAEERMSAQQIASQDFDYRVLVGSLKYLVRGTRPENANVVRELSKYLSCYNKTYWVAARRVLKYLKGTSTYGLVLDGNSRTVTYEVYTDASFAYQTKECKSVTGYVISMAGSSVSWCSSKQDSISSRLPKRNSLHLVNAVNKASGFGTY